MLSVLESAVPTAIHSLLCCVGTTLEIVTDRSQEGSQFCKGFGGIGGECEQLVSLSWKNALRGEQSTIRRHCYHAGAFIYSDKGFIQDF